MRYAGLDVTVRSSDDRRAAGKLSRQGPPTLRWAAFEVAKRAWRKASPDHEYYLRTKERHNSYSEIGRNSFRIHCTVLKCPG